MTSPQRRWLDRNLPLAERVESLLSAMTLDEKIGQMWQVHTTEPVHDENIRKGLLGSFLNIPRDELARVQRIAVEEFCPHFGSAPATRAGASPAGLSLSGTGAGFVSFTRSPSWVPSL
ncbi:MAG: hypothetical protein WC205_00005, partial [Opitutaceae bacterium]